MSAFTPDGSNGGAFACTAGTYAIADVQVTTAEPTKEVTLRFTVGRRPLFMRVGAALGDQEIVNNTEFKPGDHVFSFTPGVSPYHVAFELREVGEAALSNFSRLAPGLDSLLRVPTPWPFASARSLRSEQMRDVQWWAHGAFQPRVLERRATNSWSLRLYQPKNGPFEDPEDTDVTLTPSARTGTATIMASKPTFRSDDVGSLIKLTQAGQYRTANASAVDQATDTIRVSGIGENRNFYYRISGTFVGTVKLQRSVGTEVSWVDVQSFAGAADSQLNDALDSQIVYYRLIKTAHTSGTAVLELTYSGGITAGTGRIHAVVADNNVTVDVLEPFATLNATADWARGSWSDRFGWPQVVCQHDGRLAWLRTGLRWQSQSDDFENMEIGPLEGDAISGTIPGQMNTPRWMKSAERLVFATSGGEGAITAGADDNLMIPGNVRARIKTHVGSADADAVFTNTGELVFVNRHKRRLVLLIEDGGVMVPFDLTRLHTMAAGALSGGGFRSLAWQNEPEPRLLALREDGQLVQLLLNVQERIGAISRIVPAGTNAKIVSICVLPGTPEDQIFWVVERTVDGSTMRTIEKVMPERWENSSEAWRLQTAKVYSGAAATAIDGLDALEGQEVWAWANGRRQGPFTVEEGAITLSTAATYAIVGLRYVGKYKGPRPFTVLNALTKGNTLKKIGMILHKCAGGLLGWGRALNEITDYLPDKTSETPYDAPLPLFDGVVEFPFVGSANPETRVCLEFSGVGPAGVLGYVAFGETGQ